MKRYLLIGLTALLAIGVVATSQAAGRAEKKPPGAKKTTICHRTSSGKKPYVRIKVATRAGLAGHARHAADIIPAPAGPCPTTVLTPAAGGQALTAALTGAAEVPGPGDPDGSGTATVRLRAGEGRLCFQLSAVNITLPASAAHVHLGAAGVQGAVVIALSPPGADGLSSGCVTVARTLVAAILANPAGYYVNVHTSDFPDGAVRGQLSP
jgi:hypothetical protein